jgi:hypothetical protein
MASMTNQSFKRFIINILNNENIHTSPTSTFYNFHDIGLNWCKDWTTIFKKILNDIKAGINYETDNDNKIGNCVVKGPLANTIEWLSVYFTIKDKEYTLYMIKLEKPNDVYLKDFHSIP